MDYGVIGVFGATASLVALTSPPAFVGSDRRNHIISQVNERGKF